ncbi:LacI family DNA-binding transcriptional regulator [Oceaniglobus trochenteri]|uniref:LacI family DNA-binding transcriptional regulator n=1 Tax=Oceaniglobus trochenteri TaxID=2763260 RepID=UPI001CFF61D9|nr:LacI family DNA-binding transcriptional regulator [Oceaniglobus trochenteri]
MPQRRPTIIDVARKAGVSKSTVSLVLRNSEAVRSDTRDLVRAAMADLGYVYNRAAANMRAANGGLIGLVINDLRNPFFTEFATSLQMALSERGYSTVLANTDENPALQVQVVVSMIEHGVSAFILCPTYGDGGETFDAIARAGIPAMQMLRGVDPRLASFPFAAPDYLDGSRQATRHLVDLGARHIAFVGGLDGRGITEERMAGYREVVASLGLEPLVLTGRSSRRFGRESVQRLLADHPQVDGAVCFNDLVALGMLSGLNAAGVRAGRDFRIVGFDDIEEAAQAFPPLSSVRCDIAGFGAGAADTLLRWLEDGETPPPETRSPVTIALRESSLGR